VGSVRRGRRWPLWLVGLAVTGVVLGALYMLWFAQRFLFGKLKAPHLPITTSPPVRSPCSAAIVVAMFALGLFPDEPMGKTELAARQFQQLVETAALPSRACDEHMSVILAMLPEHALLVGLCALIVIEVAGGKGRTGLAVARCRGRRGHVRRDRAVVRCYAAAPFAGHFSINPQTEIAKAVISRSRCPCCWISRTTSRHPLPAAPALLALRDVPARVVGTASSRCSSASSSCRWAGSTCWSC